MKKDGLRVLRLKVSAPDLVIDKRCRDPLLSLPPLPLPWPLIGFAGLQLQRTSVGSMQHTVQKKFEEQLVQNARKMRHPGSRPDLDTIYVRCHMSTLFAVPLHMHTQGSRYTTLKFTVPFLQIDGSLNEATDL